MGERPEGTTIDRLRVNGNYEPGNCQWSNAHIQQNNKQNSVRAFHEGQSLTIKELSSITGILEKTLWTRKQAGVSLDSLANKPNIQVKKSEKINKVVELYKTIKNTNEISRLTGITQSSVWRYLKGASCL